MLSQGRSMIYLFTDAEVSVPKSESEVENALNQAPKISGSSNSIISEVWKFYISREEADQFSGRLHFYEHFLWLF
jgi:hypothetical protein